MLAQSRIRTARHADGARPTTVRKIAVPVGGTVESYIEYTIVADDDRLSGLARGSAATARVNKGGTERRHNRRAPGAATEVFAEARARDAHEHFHDRQRDGSNKREIRANAVSSLAERRLRSNVVSSSRAAAATLTFNP